MSLLYVRCLPIGWNGVVYRFVAILFSFFAVAQTSRGAVIAGPLTYNGHTYYLLDSASWSASEAQAVGLGGHLATINNLSEQQWVYSTFIPYALNRESRPGLWIGLRDRTGANNYGWISGEPLGFTHWAGGEPNSPGIEGYVHMIDPEGDPGDPGRWNNVQDSPTDGPVTLFGVVEVATCPVGPMTTGEESCPAFNSLLIVEDFRDALTDLRSILPPGASITEHCGWRSAAVQDHLYEIKKKFQALQKLPGLSAYVDGNGRPQITNSSGSTSCQAIIDKINEECRMHLLLPTRTDGSPAVNKTSPHQFGQAVDMNWFPPSLDIDSLAIRCGIHRPDPVGDYTHFELIDVRPPRKLGFKGNSPINILVTDPAGRRIGYGSVIGATVNDFGTNAYYSGPGTTPQIIEIDASESRFGNYRVSGVGIGPGSYSVTVEVEDEAVPGTYIKKILSAGMAATGQPIAPIHPVDCIGLSMTLAIQPASEGVLLRAPPWATGAVLEVSTDMSPGSWLLYQQPIDFTNGVSVSNLSGGSRFFRLATHVDPASASLGLSMNAFPSPVKLSSNLTCVLGVANFGPAQANDVILTNLLSPGVQFVSAQSSRGSCSLLGRTVTCTLGNLAPGSNATISIVARANTAGFLTNSAGVSAMQSDLSLSDNVASAVTRVDEAAWVAFNDHYRGPASSNYCTFWNVYGTPSGGALTNGGPLRDIADGSVLSATLTIISNSLLSTGTVMGRPDLGTSADLAFGRYIDFGTDDLNHAILLRNGTVTYAFSNLNPLAEYTFQTTACRTNPAYALRWTRCDLQGALSFSNMHTVRVMTSANVPDLAANQVAFNSGDNRSGDLVRWERIRPSANGTFRVVFTGYGGNIATGFPGAPGPAAGISDRCYAPSAASLEERLIP